MCCQTGRFSAISNMQSSNNSIQTWKHTLILDVCVEKHWVRWLETHAQQSHYDHLLKLFSHIRSHRHCHIYIYSVSHCSNKRWHFAWIASALGWTAVDRDASRHEHQHSWKSRFCLRSTSQHILVKLIMHLSDRWPSFFEIWPQIITCCTDCMCHYHSA